MKKLEETFQKDIFILKQIWRNDKYAIYEQYLGSDVIAYELIRIINRKQRKIYGHNYEAGEYYPTNKDWGVYGWTFRDINDLIDFCKEKGIYIRYNALSPSNGR